MIRPNHAAYLTEAEYVLAFGAFRAAMNQDQHAVLADWFANRFIPEAQFGDRDIHYGSFGVATGALDARLIRALAQAPGIKLRSVTLSEPNDKHFAGLEETVKDLAASLPSVDFFTCKSTLEDFQSGGAVPSFDLVVGSQIFYYFTDRLAALRKLHGMVSARGRLLIAHQTPIGINAIHRELLEKFGGPIERMFHMEQIIQLVRQERLSYSRELLWADLDVSGAFDPESEKAKWLLSFLIYLNVRRMPESQVDVLRESVLRNSYFDGTRRIFPQFVGVLTVNA